MLAERIKKQMLEAMKARDKLTKEVLAVALGEIQTGEARSGKPASDEEAAQIVKKLVKSNEETLAVATDAAQKATLQREIEILGALLPKTLGTDEIVALLAPVQDDVRAAKNDGQATGVAMKHLKSVSASVSGKDVAEAVKKIRT